ncbi:MAG: TatD family hydrolase [Alphaproteobacteria bacterium]|nr:TatD family hydrolase [Alphaproteobacteria bacterium]
MIYIDAHCHLLKETEFQDAQLVGVGKILVNSAHMADWDKLKNIKGIIPSIGVHPWYTDEATGDWAENMEKRLSENPEIQVGEIGLDKLKPDFTRQKQIFLTQLKLAQKYNRVVSIHCMRAWGEMMPLLRPFKKDTRMLFHGFTGDKIVVGFLADSQSYFSVHNDKKIPIIPPDKLLIESDAPDGMASPVALPFLYQQLGVNPEQIFSNFERLINGR